MKKLLILFFFIFTVFVFSACGEDLCSHRDADDNGMCDTCGTTYLDGADLPGTPVCQHRDADDNSKCDTCGAVYIDGTDLPGAPVCQHRDADDNGKCDKCSLDYTDGTDVFNTVIYPENVSLPQGTLTLTLGEIKNLIATLSPATTTESILNWESSNPLVAAVSGGAVVALSEGSTVISVRTVNGKCAYCVVYVAKACIAHRDANDDITCDICGAAYDDGAEIIPSVENITLNKNSLELLIGSAETLHAITTPITSAVTWISSDSTVATVISGVVIATGVGRADITAKVGEISATCQVEVKPISVEGISLNYSEYEIFRYGKTKLTATVYPENATDKRIIWSSSDESVLTVDNLGNVTTLKDGIATVSATTLDGSKISSCVFNVKRGYVNYELNTAQDFYIVTGYEGFEKEIEIQRLYDGLRVIKIADNAFYDNDNITSITIPNSVEVIGKYAFYSCDFLESLTVPDGLISIEKSAFQSCAKLSTVSFEGNLSGIGEKCFNGCSSLNSVVFKDSVDYVGNECFAFCVKLNTVEFRSSVTAIGKYAFYECINLPKITIPDTVKTVSEGTFKNCSSLASVTLGGNLESIDALAFDNCDSLSSVSIPDTVRTIGNMAFRHNESLTSVKFSESLTSIGSAAFQYCKVLDNVNIPSQVTAIGNSAFSYCYGMKTLVICATVKNWGNSTFYECRKLREFYLCSALYQELTDNNYIFYNAGIDGDGITLTVSKNAIIPSGLFQPCENKNYPKITAIVFEDGTKKIDYLKTEKTFEYLESVTIPISLTNIYAKAFYGYTGLTVNMKKDDYHYFGAWYDNADFIGNETHLNSYSGESEYLYPKWIPYSLELNKNINKAGSIVSESGNYAYKETVSAIASSNDGYTFLGWYENGVCISTDLNYSFPIERATVLTATWKATDYTLIFNADGGEVTPESKTVTYTMEYTLPVPTKKGYSFAGWFCGETEYTGGVWLDTEDVTLVAKWNPNTYKVTYSDTEFLNDKVTVTFNYNYSGAIASTVTLTNGQTLSYPSPPTRGGYVFTGWYVDQNCTSRYNFSGTITDDMTLYAGWTEMSLASVYSETQINPSDYTSSSDYYSVSTSNTSSSYRKHIYVVAQESGTHFIYWKNGSSSSSYGYYLQIYNLTKGTTIRSSSNTYSTSYNYTSFSCSAGDVIVISLYRYNTNYSSTAYFYFSGFSNASSTATAKCLEIAGYVYEKDASVVRDVKYDSELNLPTPTRRGYTFLGWYNGEFPIESGIWNTTSNMTLKPKWQANTNVIMLDADGGTVSESSIPVTYDKNYTLPEPTKTGYTFLGWYNGEAMHTAGAWNGLEDLTLIAKWTANTYTVAYCDTEELNIEIKYNYNYSGSPSATYATAELFNGEALSYIPTISRSGYVFTGWYTTEDCTVKYSFSGTVTEDMTLYAGWTEMSLASVYSETQVNPSDYTSSSDYYSVSTSNTSSSYRKHIYVVAQESDTHYIYWKNSSSSSSYGYYLQIYNLTKGTIIRSSSNTYSTSYSYTSFSCSAGDVIVISLYRYNTSYTSTASFYFVGFTSQSSTATVDCIPYGYSEGSTSSTTVTFGSSCELPNLTRSGYTFLGWYNGNEKIESGDWRIASDVTLIPMWEAVSEPLDPDATQ